MPTRTRASEVCSALAKAFFSAQFPTCDISEFVANLLPVSCIIGKLLDESDVSGGFDSHPRLRFNYRLNLHAALDGIDRAVARPALVSPH